MLEQAWVRWCALSVAIFLAGIAVGRLTARPHAEGSGRETPEAVAASRAGERPDGAETALEEALSDSWLALLRLTAEVDSLESLVETLRQQNLDPHRLVESGIARMSDRQIESLVASAVGLAAEELAEVHDVRAFAGRLSEVAMEGVLSPEPASQAADRVVLTTAPVDGDPAAMARDRFDADQTRIYASFPTDRYEQAAVMVKWYRRDRPRILLFRRYPIQPGEPYGHVWLQPRGGWEPGEYEVDVYATDEAVTPLASGRYTLEPPD